MNDVAVTAEFDYIDMDDDGRESGNESRGPVGGESSQDDPANSGGAASGEGGAAPPSQVTQALDNFDSYLDGQSHRGADDRDPAVSDGRGYDQPQVSGVFSRYDEETDQGANGEFDLFDDDRGQRAAERTLQEIVDAQQKQLRRLERRVLYQKEVIQVVSEMLVEARVVSKRELKKRLRALRDT